MWHRTGIALAVIGISVSFAQTSRHPQFEVASIRPSPESPLNQTTHFQIDGSQVRLASLTLKDYIGIAYNLKRGQVLGPDWIGSERYDIQAAIPAGSGRDQLPEMFQSLLAERFEMKFHREKKEFPVYALTLGKGLLKVKQSPPDEAGAPPVPVNGVASGSASGISVNLGNGSSWSFVPNRFEVHKLTMEVFASYLERFADQTIVDITGLKGQYDFGFDVNPEDYQPMMVRNTIAVGISLPAQALKALENSSSASLSDALETIGLKLEPRKSPLDVLVVDSARKTPTEN